jgi:hypothetical protein
MFYTNICSPVKRATIPSLVEDPTCIGAITSNALVGYCNEQGASSFGNSRMNSIREYDDSDESARIGLRRSRGV